MCVCVCARARARVCVIDICAQRQINEVIVKDGCGRRKVVWAESMSVDNTKAYFSACGPGETNYLHLSP